MFARPIFHDFKHGMVSPLPMKFELQPQRLDRDNNLLKDRSQYPLACLGRGCRMVPQPRQICRQSKNLRALGGEIGVKSFNGSY